MSPCQRVKQSSAQVQGDRLGPVELKGDLHTAFNQLPVFSTVIARPFFQRKSRSTQSVEIAMDCSDINANLCGQFLDGLPVTPRHQADEDLPLSLNWCRRIHQRILECLVQRMIFVRV